VKTNLDLAREHFPRADFAVVADSYVLNAVFRIDWLGDGEEFVLVQRFRDYDTGADYFEEVYEGDFPACLAQARTLNRGRL
jgi:hypothetical protein